MADVANIIIIVCSIVSAVLSLLKVLLGIYFQNNIAISVVTWFGNLFAVVASGTLIYSFWQQSRLKSDLLHAIRLAGLVNQLRPAYANAHEGKSQLLSLLEKLEVAKAHDLMGETVTADEWKAIPREQNQTLDALQRLLGNATSLGFAEQLVKQPRP